MTIDAAIIHERLQLIRDLLADLDQIGEVNAERLARAGYGRYLNAVARFVSA